MPIKKNYKLQERWLNRLQKIMKSSSARTGYKEATKHNLRIFLQRKDVIYSYILAVVIQDYHIGILDLV